MFRGNIDLGVGKVVLMTIVFIWMIPRNNFDDFRRVPKAQGRHISFLPFA